MKSPVSCVMYCAEQKLKIHFSRNLSLRLPFLPPSQTNERKTPKHITPNLIFTLPRHCFTVHNLIDYISHFHSSLSAILAPLMNISLAQSSFKSRHVPKLCLAREPSPKTNTQHRRQHYHHHQHLPFVLNQPGSRETLYRSLVSMQRRRVYCE